jgi:TPR repeat protein
MMYLSGEGGAKDYQLGWKLINFAAQHENTDAMLALAIATLKYVSGAPTLDEAMQYAERAESAGNPKAKAVREQLEAMKR